MDSKTPTPADDIELNLRQLSAILWRGKWFIACFTIASVVGVGTAAWLIPPKYEAIIVTLPVSSNSGSTQLGGLSSLGSQFGGLASLAGLSGNGDSKKTESVAVLQSESLTERYIKNNNLLPILYANKWDPARMTWKSSDTRKIPTLWKAFQDFKKLRTINNDTKSGLVTLKITWRNPVLAAKWANDLVNMTNDFLRTKAIAESERNITYLSDEAAKTSDVEAKRATYSLLQSEISKVMLARGSEEYAFKILDPAVVPEKPSFPQKVNWIVGGLIAGLLLSATTVLLRASWDLRSRFNSSTGLSVH